MNKWIKRILPVLTVVSLLFIFSNSLRSGESVQESKNIAVRIAESVLRCFTGREFSLDETSSIVAKIGHVLEYAVFSSLFSASVFFRNGKDQNSFYRILFCCSFVAITDEHLQLLGVNRTSRVSDVMIDLVACFLGYALVSLCYSVFQNRNKKTESVDHEKNPSAF